MNYSNEKIIKVIQFFIYKKKAKFDQSNLKRQQ